MDKLQVLKIFIVAFSIYCNISAAAASAKKRHRRKFAKSSEKLTKIRPQQFGCYLACRKKRRDSCNDKDNKHERMEYHRTNDSQPQVYWSWRQGWRSACVSAAVCWVLPSALRSSWTASVGVVTWCWPVCTAELARRCLATAAATTTRREQVAAVVTAKWRIAAATYPIRYRLSTARRTYPYFTMGGDILPPKKLPLPLGDLGHT